jgi:hypothetical protein
MHYTMNVAVLGYGPAMSYLDELVAAAMLHPIN